MTFRFSQEIIEKYEIPGYGYFRNVRLYKIFDSQSQVGEFTQFNEACILKFAGSSLRIQYIRYNLFKSRHILFDENSQTQVGEYILSGWMHKFGKLILGDERYECFRVTPDAKSSWFKRSTRGHYKIQVSNSMSGVIYKFKIDRPIIYTTHGDKFRPFPGEIELYNGNLLLVLAGLFFLEVVFDKEDAS